MVAPQLPNMSALALPFLLPQWPVGKAMTKGLTASDLQAVRALVDETPVALGRARPRRPDGRLVIEEIVATAALLRLACDDARLRLAGDGTLASVEPADRDALASGLARPYRGAPPAVARALSARWPRRQRGVVRARARLLPHRYDRSHLVRPLRLTGGGAPSTPRVAKGPR